MEDHEREEALDSTPVKEVLVGSEFYIDCLVDLHPIRLRTKN